MQDLPIISEQGLRLGAIQDAYFDPTEQRVIAFVVDWENDLVRGPENLLPLMQISGLNADIVTVPNELGVSAGLEHDFQIETEGLLLAVEQVVGDQVKLAAGTVLGEIVDVMFDPTDGSVAFYEVGPVGDTVTDQPTALVAPEPTFEFAERVLTVPDDVQARMTRRAKQQQAEGPEVEPTLNVAFLEANEDRVGEDDIEVTRSQTQQPY
jgi:uncharacterized protein YrrD